MNFQVRKTVLLTGAGFTHNFGGFLATKMWERIFNFQEIRNYPSLVQLLKDDDDFDYESAYHQVMYGEFSPEEQRAFTNAITTAYDQLDKVLCESTWGPGSQYPVNIHGVDKLIRRFAGERRRNVRGYFFTLNQDLFVDRRFRYGTLPEDGQLTIPGLPHHMVVSPAQWNRPFTTEDYLEVPKNDEMAANKARNDDRLSSSGQFHYIKLHGSMNWRSSDGRGVMVIGRHKLDQIEGEPLLNWYFETFKKILSLGDMNLFITGYGFGDSHINEVIADSIEQHGLKLYAIYPEDLKKWKLKLLEKKHGQTFWDGLERYDSYALKDLYPADQRETGIAQEIEELIQGIS